LDGSPPVSIVEILPVVHICKLTARGRQEKVMNDLKGKVAVVTGASKGIGAAIAKSLSAAGAAVVVNYSSSREGAD
jgi:3-oxoacyl-ACP reductase-like protein